MATYTRVRTTGSGSTGGGTLNLSFGALPAAGNAIFVEAAFNTGIGTTAVTDNQGNTYTKAASANRVGFVSEIWYTFNIGAPSGTFTVTITGATNIWGAADEWSGFGTLNPLFTTGSGSTSGNQTITATLSTTNPDAVGIVATAAANVFAVNIQAPYTQDWNFGGFQGGGGHYIISTIGSQSVTINSSGGYSIVLAIFQDPADFSSTRATQIVESFVASTPASPVRATQISEGFVTTTTGAVRATQIVLTLIANNVIPPGIIVPTPSPGSLAASRNLWGLERFDIKVHSEETS